MTPALAAVLALAGLLAAGPAPGLVLLDAVETGKRVVAVGERGQILLSDDAGRSWRTAASPPTPLTLTRVVFSSERTGFAVGHGGLILASHDAGDHWNVVEQGQAANPPLFDVLFTDAQNGVAVGGFGTVRVTRDGGVHWENRDSGDPQAPHLYALLAHREGLLAAGEGGAVYISEDGGSRWRRQPVPGTGSHFGGLALFNGSALLFGMRGERVHLGRERSDWRVLKEGGEETLGCGAQLSDGTILLAGSGGRLLVSRDEARTFAERQLPVDWSVARVLPLTGGALLLVGEGGLRRLDGLP